jgi:hypothetical protein
MKKLQLLITSFLLLNFCNAQVYNRAASCGTDTIHVNYRNRMTWDSVNYKGFECTQVGKLGIRFDLGQVLNSYSRATRNWLGNHGSIIIAVALMHDKYNIGLKLKGATTNPKALLAFNGDTVIREAKLNPIRLDFYGGYSFDFRYNISLEPYVGVTRNMFYVINEEEINKTYRISKLTGLNTGITLNKYFRLKQFQFLSIFLTYGYGFSNFKKINDSLGYGYSEWNFGLAYKVFTKKHFHKKIL